ENLGRYVVKGAGNEPKYNSRMEAMTLEEFYQDYASRKAHMVRGDVRTGASSSANSRFDVRSDGKVPLHKLFGKNSEASLASELARRDIKEYQRLKVIAKQNGLLK